MWKPRGAITAYTDKANRGAWRRGEMERGRRRRGYMRWFKTRKQVHAGQEVDIHPAVSWERLR